MTDLENSKYQLVEWRLSIYGRKAAEWATLARWVYVNKLVGGGLIRCFIIMLTADCVDITSRSISSS